MNRKLILVLLGAALLLSACSTDETAAPVTSLSAGTSVASSTASASAPSGAPALSQAEPLPIHFADAETTTEEFFQPYTSAFLADFPSADITQMRWQFFEGSDKDTFVIQGIDGDKHLSAKYILLNEPIKMGETVEPFTEEKQANSAFPKTALDATDVITPSQMETIINDKYDMELTEIIFQNTHNRPILLLLFRDKQHRHYQVAMDPFTGEILGEFFQLQNGDESK